VLPEDFVGSTDCWSEKMLAVPKAAFPFVPPKIDPRGMRRAPESERDGLIRVAVPASTMKLNPPLLRAFGAIGRQAKQRVQFEFYPLASRGITHLHLSSVVAKHVPGAIVYAEAPYEVYLNRLSVCDFFLSPFPYGNMNSIIDAVSLGLPGVCLDGPEAHSHADAAMFARLGFPKELSAQRVEDYVASAVRLINNPNWREQCRAAARDCDLEGAFFTGDARPFCDAIYALVAGQQAERPSGARRKTASV
jgi:hypothetical protein